MIKMLYSSTTTFLNIKVYAIINLLNNKFYFQFTSRDVKVILFTLKSPATLGHVQYNNEL